MKDFIYQINENECGYAALKMLIACFYKDERYLFMKHKESLNHQYSLLEIKNIAKDYGLILGGYIEKSRIDILSMKKPFILIKTTGGNKKHAVLVKKTYKHFSYVYDPALGKKLISNKKLYEDITDGIEVLIVESFSKSNIEIKLPALVKKKDAAILMLFESLAIAFYFIGAYFISPECYMTFPIIFFVIGVLLSILYRLFSYRIMQRFDDEFIKYTYDDIALVRKDNYLLMHKTKSSLFSTIYRFLLNLISAIAVNTILILNNHYLFYIIVVSFLIVFIDYFFITPNIKNESYKLEKIEDNLLRDKLDINQYENNYALVKEKTYHIAKRIELKRIISYFILLMVTFFVSGMRNEANVYFILFNFALCLFTYTSFFEAFKCIDTYKDDLINKVKFYDLIIK